MPSQDHALTNWTAAKAQLPSGGVLGFFLGVWLLCRARALVLLLVFLLSCADFVLS